MRQLRPNLVVALLLPGCATMTEVNSGPVVALPTKEDASFGGAVALHGALGTSNETTNAMTGLDLNAKAKVTAATQNIAFGSGLLFARPIGSKGEGLLRTGLHLVFERFDEELIVGGGPYAALMGGITLDEDVYYVPGHLFAHWRRDRTLLTFGPFAEIDARFSRPSAVAFAGIAFGIAWASEVVAAPPPIFPLEPQKPPRSSNLCAPDDRSGVQASCPGVQYLD
jgi:hypothetical protein